MLEKQVFLIYMEKNLIN